MRKSKKLRMIRFMASLVATSVLFTISAYAVPESIEITDVSIQQTESGKGIVTVKAYNPLDEDNNITLLLMKKDTALSDASHKVYAALDIHEAEKVSSNEVQFIIEIPDIRDNDGTQVASKGEYKLSFRNGNGEQAEKTFFYASASEIATFMTSFEAAITRVVNSNIAYEELDDVICDANKAEMFSIGADFDIYQTYVNTYGSQSGNEVFNWIYDYSKVNGITKDTFSEDYTTALAAGIFNHENKRLDDTVLVLDYNGASLTSDILSEASTMMQASYSSIATFKKDLINAYGITCINRATMTDIDTMLATFKTEAGECTDEINAIQGLSLTNQYKAYEYIVANKATAKVTTVSGLKILLENAYKAATTVTPPAGGSSGGGGGGGGGGAFGTPDNKTVSNDANAFPSLAVDPLPGNTTKVFTDLASDHWAAESVSYLKDKEIVNGTDTGSFEPDRSVTREEFTKMLILAFGIDTEVKAANFEDVDSDAWYAPYISAAVTHGIVNGIGENRFGIGQNISRQDMAVMVARAAEKVAVSLNSVRTYMDFGDETSIADYAKDSVKTLYRAGILNGKGENTFDPTGNATRAEAAKIIFEVIGGNS